MDTDIRELLERARELRVASEQLMVQTQLFKSANCPPDRTIQRNQASPDCSVQANRILILATSSAV